MERASKMPSSYLYD
ncbi:protein YadX [Escherichia albertii]|nr:MULTISPECIES: hypothetical protein [Escherichia]MBW7372276.1 protein YadX [Escherichia coli]MCB2259396.1 protein YadX [Escherichia albertii]MCB2267035.1 protein YadX [Escherichia albertii]MCB2269563.1 protein YadX [Escherichia albertii]MCD9383548.1 protein YadX [Escherichia coli]